MRFIEAGSLQTHSFSKYEHHLPGSSSDRALIDEETEAPASFDESESVIRLVSSTWTWSTGFVLVLRYGHSSTRQVRLVVGSPNELLNWEFFWLAIKALPSKLVRFDRGRSMRGCENSRLFTEACRSFHDETFNDDCLYQLRNCTFAAATPYRRYRYRHDRYTVQLSYTPSKIEYPNTSRTLFA